MRVGIKRVVYKSLESAVVQDRLQAASAWSDYPGPEALAVAMDLGNFRVGHGTEVIKLINLPLPKGMASDLTPAGAKAYHVVDQLHNARCQRLSENLANRNIGATDIARIVKSITTFQLSRNQELVLVDDAHLFLGANSRGTGYTREAGSWGDFLDMISNSMEVMFVAFPTLFPRATSQALLSTYLVIKNTTSMSEVAAIQACHDKLFCANILALATQFRRTYLDTAHGQVFLPLHMLIGPSGHAGSQAPMLDSQRTISDTQHACYRAVYENDPKAGGCALGIRSDFEAGATGRPRANTGVVRKSSKPAPTVHAKCSSCARALSKKELAAQNGKQKQQQQKRKHTSDPIVDDPVDDSEAPAAGAHKKPKTGAKKPFAASPHDIGDRALFNEVDRIGFCDEDFKLSEQKLKAVIPFSGVGCGWATQADGTFQRGKGGLCKTDAKSYVFSKHCAPCQRGAGCTFRHMTVATAGGAAWCPDRTAAHKTALGQGMPNLAAYTQSGAIPTLP